MKNKKTLILIIIVVIAVVGIATSILKKADSTDDIEKINIDAGQSIEITEIGSYTGPYMEDGSDSEVSDVLMIKIKNTGKKDIQYGEITLYDNTEKAGIFKFSTLMAGDTVTVLENNKTKFDKKAEYKNAGSSNVALFQTEPKLYSDKIEIQSLEGGINVTNISNNDIDGDILIYFKDCKEDELLGGITYRGRIEGGMEKGEIRQLMSNNFTENNTKVMFVTIDGK